MRTYKLPKTKVHDSFLAKKLISVVERMKIIREMYRKTPESKPEYYALKIERELLQISKHIIFMLDIIKLERKRFGLTLKDDTKN